MPVDQESFLFGFFAGFVVASYFAVLVQQIAKNRSVSKKPGQTTAVVVKAEKSPRQILKEAAWASTKTLFLYLLLFVSFLVIGYVVMDLLGYSLYWP